MKKALLLLSLLVLTVSLTACGGSSGHSEPSTDLTGAVAATPVKDAKVMVAFKYLTKSAQKASDKNAPIVVGTTDKNGKIDFKASAVKKLDRSKNVIMYSVGGVKFLSEYNTVKGVENAGAAAAGNLFKGQLRAVLAPKATKAYLTVANSLVADMVEDGETIANAQKLVKNIVRNQLRIKAMKDIFASPLTDLTASEFVSQALLLTANVTEAEFAAAPVKLTSYDKRRYSFEAVVTRVKAALKDAAKEAELTKEYMTETTPCAYIVDYTAKGLTSALKEIDGRSELLVKEADLDRTDLIFNVASFMSNETTGYFALVEQSATGNLNISGIAAEMNKAYQHEITFSFVPAMADGKVVSEADKKAFAQASFTFAAVDAEGKLIDNVDPITVIIRKVGENELVVEKLTFTVTNKEIEFNTTSTDIADSDIDELNIGEKSLANELNITTATVGFFSPDAPTAKQLENVKIRLVAPEGFDFIDTTKADTRSHEVRIAYTESNLTRYQLIRTSRVAASHVIDDIKAYVLVGGEAVALYNDEEQVVTYEDYKVKETNYYEAVLCGFAPINAFGKVREFALLEGKDGKTADFSAATPLAGTVKATFKTWSLARDVAEAVRANQERNDSYGAEYGTDSHAVATVVPFKAPYDSFKAYAMDEDGDVIGAIDYGRTAVTTDTTATFKPSTTVSTLINPSDAEVLVVNSGKATVTFDLANSTGVIDRTTDTPRYVNKAYVDSNNDVVDLATASGPAIGTALRFNLSGATVTQPEEYFIRIMPVRDADATSSHGVESVATRSACDAKVLPNNSADEPRIKTGGVEVIDATPVTITITGGVATGTPKSITVVKNVTNTTAKDTTVFTDATLRFTLTVASAETVAPNRTDIFSGWTTTVAGTDMTSALLADQPVVTKTPTGYQLVFTLKNVITKDSDSATNNIINVVHGSTIPGWTVAVEIPAP